MESIFSISLDFLPEELILMVLSFIFDFKDLARLSMTCRQFYNKINNEQILWKNLCLSWWIHKGLDKSSPWSLIEILVEIKDRDWQWFSKCFANEGSDKHKWIVDFVEEDNEAFLYCGELRNGIAFTLKFPSSISQGYLAVGSYLNGHMQEGTYIANGLRIIGQFKKGKVNGNATMIQQIGETAGETFTGEYVDNEKHGIGTYLWKNGVKYQGSFQKDRRHGLGKMSFPNGFQFECIWKNDQPKNWEIATHPDVMNAIHEDICTFSFTGNSTEYPQFLYKCFQCGTSRKFCVTCWNNCHHFNDHWSRFEWYAGQSCSCGDDCQIKANVNPNKRQKIE